METIPTSCKLLRSWSRKVSSLKLLTKLSNGILVGLTCGKDVNALEPSTVARILKREKQSDDSFMILIKNEEVSFWRLSAKKMCILGVVGGLISEGVVTKVNECCTGHFFIDDGCRHATYTM